MLFFGLGGLCFGGREAGFSAPLRSGRDDSLLGILRFGRNDGLLGSLRFGRSDGYLGTVRFGRNDGYLGSMRFGRNYDVVQGVIVAGQGIAEKLHGAAGAEFGLVQVADGG